MWTWKRNDLGQLVERADALFAFLSRHDTGELSMAPPVCLVLVLRYLIFPSDLTGVLPSSKVVSSSILLSPLRRQGALEQRGGPLNKTWGSACCSRLLSIMITPAVFVIFFK